MNHLLPSAGHPHTAPLPDRLDPRGFIVTEGCRHGTTGAPGDAGAQPRRCCRRLTMSRESRVLPFSLTTFSNLNVLNGGDDGDGGDGAAGGDDGDGVGGAADGDGRVRGDGRDGGDADDGCEGIEVDAIDEADERDTAGEVGGVMSDPSGTVTAGVLRGALRTGCAQRVCALTLALRRAVAWSMLRSGHDIGAFP